MFVVLCFESVQLEEAKLVVELIGPVSFIPHRHLFASSKAPFSEIMDPQTGSSSSPWCSSSFLHGSLDNINKKFLSLSLTTPASNVRVESPPILFKILY
ncbi:hypothetical protein D9619_003642 [Psilocybe cf. subviscida]|uniref:Uncharacterized protein n=1 Tax=Psilocybe cf. subviscida TaxID=2480587 RepID=A0A8H5AWV2_9AGAR|nr:hypothetical protein D9619_003642 [Psilocybe cf. subviscida]